MSSILGYRSMLSSVFRFKSPEISNSAVLRDLRSFKMEALVQPVHPPSWDLDAVLRYLNSPTFEPFSSASLRSLTKKVLFLVGEMQAVSCHVSFASSDACLSSVPEFLAKTESSSNPLPRSVLVKSLLDFAMGLANDLLLCPV